MSVVTLCDRFSSCGFAARSVVAVVSLPAVAVLSLPAVAVPGFAASSATIRSLTDCVFITSMRCRTTGAVTASSAHYTPSQPLHLPAVHLVHRNRRQWYVHVKWSTSIWSRADIVPQKHDVFQPCCMLKWSCAGHDEFCRARMPSCFVMDRTWTCIWTEL